MNRAMTNKDTPADSPEQELLEGLARLERMQTEQREALAAGNLQGLVRWQEERAELFRRLMQGFDRLAAATVQPGARSRFSPIRERLGIVLAGEKLLAGAVEEQKKDLQQRLHAMRKGKKALHKYRMHQGMVSSPRYLQNKT